MVLLPPADATPIIKHFFPPGRPYTKLRWLTLFLNSVHFTLGEEGILQIVMCSVAQFLVLHFAGPDNFNINEVEGTVGVFF